MEDICHICLKQCPVKQQLDTKVATALNDIFQLDLTKDSAFPVCAKCTTILLEFHQFFLETRKNLENFQKIQEVSFQNDSVKVEEFFDESTGSLEVKEVDISQDPPNSNWNEIECSRRKSPSTKKRKPKSVPKKAPYVCDLCGKAIHRFGNLRSHIEKTHLRVRKFQCHLCGDNFFGSNNLKFHLTTHDTSRPRSQCKICGVLVLDLKKHFKTSHNDSNPVVCNVCGKSLMNEMKLRYHTYKRHPPQGKFKCHICDKDFCNALYLKEHTHQKHIGGFLYTCEWCDFQTNYSKNMPTHQKLKHKEEYEARRRARPPRMSRLHEMKATLALQDEQNTS